MLGGVEAGSGKVFGRVSVTRNPFSIDFSESRSPPKWYEARNAVPLRIAFALPKQAGM